MELTVSWSFHQTADPILYSQLKGGRREGVVHWLMMRVANRKVAGLMTIWSESWFIAIAPLSNALKLILLQGDFWFVVPFNGDIVWNM